MEIIYAFSLSRCPHSDSGDSLGLSFADSQDRLRSTVYSGHAGFDSGRLQLCDNIHNFSLESAQDRSQKIDLQTSTNMLHSDTGYKNTNRL